METRYNALEAAIYNNLKEQNVECGEVDTTTSDVTYIQFYIGGRNSDSDECSRIMIIDNRVSDISKILYPDGSKAFSYIWANRASYLSTATKLK